MHRVNRGYIYIHIRLWIKNKINFFFFVFCDFFVLWHFALFDIYVEFCRHPQNGFFEEWFLTNRMSSRDLVSCSTERIWCKRRWKKSEENPSENLLSPYPSSKKVCTWEMNEDLGNYSKVVQVKVKIMLRVIFDYRCYCCCAP